MPTHKRFAMKTPRRTKKTSELGFVRFKDDRMFDWYSENILVNFNFKKSTNP